MVVRSESTAEEVRPYTERYAQLHAAAAAREIQNSR
jgi:hypothetical protein